MSRERGVVETAEYVAFARRAIRGLGNRLADADLDDMRTIIELFGEFEDIMLDGIERWVDAERGLPAPVRLRTWTAIGKMFGISRQAAQQRWSRAGRANVARAYRTYRDKGASSPN